MFLRLPRLLCVLALAGCRVYVDTSTDSALDGDGDGWDESEDCDDGDAAVNPGASETCNNGQDDDCDGTANGCSLASGGIGTVADVAIEGESYLDAFGQDLQIVADLTGDGAAELVVAAPTYGASDFGAVYYFANSGTLPSLTADASATLEGIVLETGYGIAVGDVFDGDGYEEIVVGSNNSGAWIVTPGALGTVSVSSVADASLTHAVGGVGSFLIVGDFDNGGADIVIGAVNDDEPHSESGRAWLVSDAALRASSAIALDTNGEVVDLQGAGANDRAGFVSNAGDLDLDGSDDLVVGAEYAQDAGVTVGVAYIFNDPDVLDGAHDTALTVADANVVITGSASGDRLGHTWAVGDLVGDGSATLAVAAPYEDSAGADAGAVYLIGGTSVASGTAASLAYAAILAENAGDSLGARPHSVGAGDLDCDGQTDLALGAPEHNDGATGAAGAVYVTWGPVAGSLTLDSAGDDLRFVGAGSSHRLGFALDVGDLDGEGCDDLAVGAPQWSVGSGMVYVLYGGAL